MTQLEKIKSTAEYISSRLSMNAPIGIVLGTGLGKLADEIEEARSCHILTYLIFRRVPFRGMMDDLFTVKLEVRKCLR